MLIQTMTVSSKVEGQFCSVTVELDEFDDARPEALAHHTLDLKLRTSTSCILHAIADGTLTPEQGKREIAVIRAQITTLKEKLKP